MGNMLQKRPTTRKTESAEKAVSRKAFSGHDRISPPDCTPAMDWRTAWHRRRDLLRVTTGDVGRLHYPERMALSKAEREEVLGYLDFARKNLSDNVAIYLRPEHWLSSDQGSF